MATLTEAVACGAWSVADEILLEFEMSRKDPAVMGDFICLAVKVAAGGDGVRENAIRLGVLAMRVALGETLVVDVEEGAAA